MIGKASILVLVIYLILFLGFHEWFGESPINLVGLGGHDGAGNALFNFGTYSILAFLIGIIPSFFITYKKKWFFQSAISAFIASPYITVLYLALTSS
jgi:hypothetical protein